MLELDLLPVAAHWPDLYQKTFRFERKIFATLGLLFEENRGVSYWGSDEETKSMRARNAARSAAETGRIDILEYLFDHKRLNVDDAVSEKCD